MINRSRGSPRESAQAEPETTQDSCHGKLQRRFFSCVGAIIQAIVYPMHISSEAFIFEGVWKAEDEVVGMRYGSPSAHLEVGRRSPG